MKEKKIDTVLGYVKIITQLDDGLRKTTPENQSRPSCREDLSERAVEEADGTQKPAWGRKEEAKKKGDEE